MPFGRPPGALINAKSQEVARLFGQLSELDFSLCDPTQQQ